MLIDLILQNIFLKSLACLAIAFASAHFGIKYFIEYTNKNAKFFQPIRKEGPKEHLKTKKNTPTMGGIFIILATIFSTILFADLKNQYIFVAIFVMFSFALIGLTDDLLKVVYKDSKGFRGSIKLIIQFAIVGLTILWLGTINSIHINNLVTIPFANYSINLGVLYFIFATFVIVGSSNAVNLTDGLDGLVSVPAIINLICLSTFILISSNTILAAQFGLTYIGNNKDLILLTAALIGAILAFLKFNLKPAKIFMGDVGSLSIGATLGLIALITKIEILFFVFSLLFVIEAVSVILQVGSYKLRKKRIFLMAPIHHHFEKLGWNEKEIVKTFWLTSFLFAILVFVLLFLKYLSS